MEGKELWKLLDFVKGLQDKADKIEKGVSEAINIEQEIKLKQKAAIYKEIAEDLQGTLKNMIVGS